MAKARGRTGGRPQTDPDKLEQARILYLHANKTAADVCRTVGIGRRTLFSYLAQVRGQKDGEASTRLWPFRDRPSADQARTGMHRPEIR
jgi:hypothetical protein